MATRKKVAKKKVTRKKVKYNYFLVYDKEEFKDPKEALEALIKEGCNDDVSIYKKKTISDVDIGHTDNAVIYKFNWIDAQVEKVEKNMCPNIFDIHFN